jgi:hypothetical protein
MVVMDKPRETGREAIRASVPAELWEKNWKFCDELKAMIKRHKLYRHPVIGVLNNETLNKEISRTLHFEFAYGFAQIFTDSLIHAMARTSDLEKRLGPQGKVSARFLLQLNLLDELGYKPAEKLNGDYYGNPALAHYLQFAETLKDLGGKPEDIFNYRPSAAALAARKTFEDHYQDYTLETCVLACAETVFTLFAGPWAKSVARSTDIDVAKGYHSIHVEDESGEFIDDDHSEDSWYLFAQAITPERYEEVKEYVESWLDIWYDFGDNVVHIARTMDRKPK